MKIIAINLLVISSLFPQRHFSAFRSLFQKEVCSFGAFRSNLPPDEELVSFIKMGMNWIFHREVVALPTNQMVFVKVEVFTRGKRLHLQGDVQREFSSLRGLIFVTKTCQEFIHLAAESFFLDSRVGKESCRFKWFKDFTKEKGTSNIFKQTCPFLLTILCTVRLLICKAPRPVRTCFASCGSWWCCRKRRCEHRCLIPRRGVLIFPRKSVVFKNSHLRIPKMFFHLLMFNKCHCKKHTPFVRLLSHRSSARSRSRSSTGPRSRFFLRCQQEECGFQLTGTWNGLPVCLKHGC